MGHALQGVLFWLLAIVPLSAFLIALFFGFWNAADRGDSGPEIDLDGESGPPP